MNSPDPSRRRKQLVKRLLGAATPELTCDECFELLDVYVEAEIAAENADLQVPGMRAHLEGCPACAEEHESLRALAANGN